MLFDSVTFSTNHTRSALMGYCTITCGLRDVWSPQLGVHRVTQHPTHLEFRGDHLESSQIALTGYLVGMLTLHWRYNEYVGVSNHQPHHCLLDRLFIHRSKKTSKIRVTSLCAGNSPGTGEFPAQMASNAENFSLWWRHHVAIWSACSLR